MCPIKGGEPKPARNDIRCLLQCDDPEDILHVCRFRHLGGVIRSAPDLVWSMLFEVPDCMTSYKESLTWAFRALGRDSCVKDVSSGSEWLLLAQSPTHWARYANRALMRYKNLRIRNAISTKSHRDIADMLQRAGCVSTQGVYPCLICERTFTAPQGWFLHANACHSFVSESSAAAQGTTCFCCAKRYKTTERLRHHLRYSGACRQLFCEQSELPEEEQPISNHPQFPWVHTEAAPVPPPTAEGRDKSDLMRDLHQPLCDFTQPEDDESFVPDLACHLQNICRRAIPFQILASTFQEWLENLTIEGDDRIVQAGLKVLDWMEHLCQQGEQMYNISSSDILNSEADRRDMKCQPFEGPGRAFLATELLVLHLFSGRRRAGDLQTQLEALTLPDGVILSVVSVDVAIDPKGCNLSDRAQQKRWLAMIADGHIAGFGGPP